MSNISAKCSLEREVLPILARSGRVVGTTRAGYFVDIGIPESFAGVQTELPAHRRRPAIFLDRDGVINHDDGYVGSRARFRWMSGAIDAIRACNDAGFFVFLVTNQSGVARGFYTEDDVKALHATIGAELREAGAHLDDVRYCPYHTGGTVAQYKRPHAWRKPEAGMLLDLMAHWNVNISKSHLVGDQDSDVAAGSKAGVATHLFTGGNLHEFMIEQGILAR